MTVKDFLEQLAILSIINNTEDSFVVEFIDHDTDKIIADYNFPCEVVGIPEVALDVVIFSVEERVDNEYDTARFIIHIITDDYDNEVKVNAWHEEYITGLRSLLRILTSH